MHSIIFKSRTYVIHARMRCVSFLNSDIDVVQTALSKQNRDPS